MSFRLKRVIVTLLLILGVMSVWSHRELMAGEAVNRISYYPAETDQVLNNPYMGFVIDAKYDDAQQPFRLAYANLTWADLEPDKGKYAFDAVEEKFQFAHWKDKGVSLIIRVLLDYPGRTPHKDIPDWLYDEIGEQGTHYDHSYGKGFSPDYNNPVLIQNHERLIQALGERYNNDPHIAFIELGSIGHWGEWHTKNDGDTPIEFPQEQVTDQYVQPYLSYFDQKRLLMRRPHQIALDHGLGLFNDTFGSHEATTDEFLHWFTYGYKSWLTQNDQPAMPDFWRSAPSGGEFASDDHYFDDDQIEETLTQLKLTHVSWLGPHAPSGEPRGGSHQHNIDRLLKTMGYRFVIVKESHEEEAHAGESLNVNLTVVNRGVAPFYFAWPVELTLTNAQGVIVSRKQTQIDIRKWLPGYHDAADSLPIPAGLAPGTYTINAAILDPLTGKPGVEFANDGQRADGRYALGAVEVLD